MKLVIASDIHGSTTWCAEMLRVVEETAPDKVLLLGDVLYHGPRNPLPDGYAPADVAAMLNPLADRIVSVRGNCDAEIDQVMLDFPCMADYAWLVDGENQLYCTHGHLWDPDEAARGLLVRVRPFPREARRDSRQRAPVQPWQRGPAQGRVAQRGNLRGRRVLVQAA